MNNAALKNPIKNNQEVENGDVICHYLNALGIEYVFGIPGGSMEPFLDSLSRSEKSGGTKFILTRHEGGSAFMADGYTRATGKIGVCCSTSGPGATNLITGVANAYADNIPMLVITSQPKIENFGRQPFQDSSCTGIDIVGMFEHCTAYNSLVSHANQLESKLIQAISTAQHTRKPVHLSIPSDIMKSKTEIKFNSKIPSFSAPTPNFNFEYVESILSSNEVCVVLGNSCIGKMEEITKVAESNRWKIVSTPSSKGLISDYHYLYRGVLGLAGHSSALSAVQDAECVLVLDADFDEMSTCGWDEKYLGNQLMLVSPNAEKIGKASFADYPIHCTVRHFTKEVLVKLTKSKPLHMEVEESELPNAITFADTKKYSNKTYTGPVKPQSLFWDLSKNTPEKYQACFDAGNSWLFGIHYWMDGISKDPNYKTFNTSMGFGSMGWAIGSSIGMAFADRSRPTICVTGDGSFLMNGTEVSTAKQHNLNVVFVVLNDSHLGMVKHGQRLGGAEQLGYELTEHDFSMMAKSMGIKSIKINCLTQLRTLDWEELYSDNGPVLLDIRVDPEEVPPLGHRTKVLAASS